MPGPSTDRSTDVANAVDQLSVICEFSGGGVKDTPGPTGVVAHRLFDTPVNLLILTAVDVVGGVVGCAEVAGGAVAPEPEPEPEPLPEPEPEPLPEPEPEPFPEVVGVVDVSETTVVELGEVVELDTDDDVDGSEVDSPVTATFDFESFERSRKIASAPASRPATNTPTTSHVNLRRPSPGPLGTFPAGPTAGVSAVGSSGSCMGSSSPTPATQSPPTSKLNQVIVVHAIGLVRGEIGCAQVQLTATSSAVQISRIRAQLKVPSRSTRTAIETLSTV